MTTVKSERLDTNPYGMGVCPHCRKVDAIVFGRDDFEFVCDEHKFRWPGPSMLPSHVEAYACLATKERKHAVDPHYPRDAKRHN
jgi:hypothetical protein